MLGCSSFSWIDFLGFSWNFKGGVMKRVIKPLSDWQVLRNRYSSTRSYKNRSALSVWRKEDFQNWLVDQGADVFSHTEQHEALRFKLHGQLGIWYQTGSGNLLMHDLAEKFKKEMGLVA